MKLKSYLLIGAVGIVIFGCAPQAAESAQTDEKAKAAVKEVDKPEYQLEATDLGQGLHMLVGQGGNIGLSSGPDGAFVIDDQFARFSKPILAKIDELSGGPLRFVVNTHYHGDHAGGNAEMRAAGATIVAHDNVRQRMSQDNENLLWGRTVKATDAAAWPNVTFSETMTFHFNNQTIDVIHVPTAHTDGDAIIYFREADVLHMGDYFFNGMFPYIDVDANGSVAGMIKALDTGIMLAGAETKIIPGHGPLSSKADMQNTRGILSTVQDRVQARIKAGDNLKMILDAEILSDYEHLSSFIDSNNMVKITYRSLTGQLD